MTENRNNAENILTDNASDLLIGLVVVVPMFIGPAIFCWQIFNWLRTANWQPIAVSDALDFAVLPHPSFNWLGLQKMSDAVLDWPLSVFALAVWFGAYCILLILLEEAAKKKRAKT